MLVRTKASLRNEIDDLKRIIRDTFWMARRYAHGRHTYVPSIVRKHYAHLKECYPDLVPPHDEEVEESVGFNVTGNSADSLHDCND